MDIWYYEVMSETEISKSYLNWANNQIGAETHPVRARSGAHSAVYELKTDTGSWYLKVGENLKIEHDRLKWLEGNLPVPRVEAFDTTNALDALLMTTVMGTDLAHLSSSLKPDDVITRFASALQAFHAVEARDCPFSAYKPGNTLVHGDACLPNFIFTDNGDLSGYIDLGDMGMGDIEVDLSAAVWSLNYNLGPGHGLKFLKAYGRHDATEEDVERLWQMYATSPIFDK
jgi:aminoglycoside phosphotransferase